MKINKIILRSFGKFQNKTFDFSEGLNVFYGENEAGKSTIHHFIEGMFFGFYKSNLKSKRNTDDYEQYLPWDNSTDYSGAMIIEDESGTYRIERSFMKGHDFVRVYNEVTGDEVTEQYDYDQVTKLYEPALKHLGINQNTYRNTVSIAQMNIKTGDELVDEIKSSLINYGETSMPDVSLTEIKSSIADKKAAIGSSRSKKSDFGKTLEKIEALEAEKEEAIHVYENIKSVQLESNQLNEELKVALQKRDIIERSMAKFKNSASAENLQKARAIQGDLTNIEEQMAALHGYTQVSKDEINEAITKANSIDVLKRELQMMEERITEINTTIESHRKEIETLENQSVEIGTSEKLIRDVYKYEEFENQKSIVQERINPKILQEAQEAYTKTEVKVKKSKGSFVMLLILTILVSLVKVFEYIKPLVLDNLSFLDGVRDPINAVHDILVNEIVSWVVLGVALLFLVLTVLVGIRRKSSKEKLSDIQKTIEREEEEQRITETRLADLDEKQKAVLDKYGCEDVVALHTLKDKKAQEELFYTESFNRTAKLEEEIELLAKKAVVERGKIEDKQREIRDNEGLLQNIMAILSVEHYEGLRFALDKQYEYERLENEKNNKLDMIKQLTNETNISLVDDQESLSEEDEGLLTVNSYDELEEELRQVNEIIVDYNKRISEFETQITSEETSVRPVVDIDDQIGLKKQKLENMSNKLEAYGLLEKAFDELTSQSSNSFAPSLNEQVSRMIAIATDYKYTDVKVNSNMDITILDNDLNKIVKAEELSAGTVDLMYFALRIGLADLINGQKDIPLILDDCFVQYDDRRLVKILELLSKIDRQILLFTCHNREKQLIDRMTQNVSIQTL